MPHDRMTLKRSLLVLAILALGHGAAAEEQTQSQYFRGHDATVGYFGDWAYGLWKGDCGYNTPIALGMSFDAGSDSFTGAVLCGSTPFAFNEFGSYVLWFNQGDNRRDYTWGDWAYGQYKAECGPTDVLIGIAQQTNGNRDAALCLPTRCRSAPTYCHAVRAWPKFFFVPGQNGPSTSLWQDNRYSQTGGDWDVGSAKLQCADNEYIKGVSRGAVGASPVILCCAQ